MRWRTPDGLQDCIVISQKVVPGILNAKSNNGLHYFIEISIKITNL